MKQFNYNENGIQASFIYSETIGSLECQPEITFDITYLSVNGKVYSDDEIIEVITDYEHPLFILFTDFARKTD